MDGESCGFRDLKDNLNFALVSPSNGNSTAYYRSVLLVGFLVFLYLCVTIKYKKRTAIKINFLPVC